MKYLGDPKSGKDIRTQLRDAVEDSPGQPTTKSATTLATLHERRGLFNW